MTTLKVDGMHCEKCVARINKALDSKKIEHETFLDNHTVTIKDDTKKSEAVSALDDIGFEAK